MGFTEALARRMNDSCGFLIKEAEDGELLMQGTGYVAPGGKHMTVHRGPLGTQIAFQDGPPRHGVKPSADYLLSTVAQTFGDTIPIGVLYREDRPSKDAVLPQCADGALYRKSVDMEAVRRRMLAYA